MQQQPELRSWHYDPTTKGISLATYQKFQLVKATQRDFNKINEMYQPYPIQGKMIANIYLIYNPVTNRKFSLELDTLNEHYGPAFKPKWPQENDSDWREKTLQDYLTISAPYKDPDFPNVNIMFGFHATSTLLAIGSICRGGYVALKKTDDGYYGQGYYSALEASYAGQVYDRCNALFVNCIASSHVYPVIHGDRAKLRGKRSHDNYDTHYIPVVPRNANHPNEIDYIACKKGQKKKFTEIMVTESAACLPRFLIELESTLPKALVDKPILSLPSQVMKADKKIREIAIQTGQIIEEVKHEQSSYDKEVCLPMTNKPITQPEKSAFNEDLLLTANNSVITLLRTKKAKHDTPALLVIESLQNGLYHVQQAELMIISSHSPPSPTSFSKRSRQTTSDTSGQISKIANIQLAKSTRTAMLSNAVSCNHQSWMISADQAKQVQVALVRDSRKTLTYSSLSPTFFREKIDVYTPLMWSESYLKEIGINIRQQPRWLDNARAGHEALEYKGEEKSSEGIEPDSKGNCVMM